MSKPLIGFSPPDFSGQTKIMFCMEGNPVALLATNAGGRRRQRSMKFKDPLAALAWCRENNAVMVYTPIAPDPAKN